MRTAAAIGLLALLAAGASPAAKAQQLTTTTGHMPAFPSFNGSAASISVRHAGEASARRHTVKLMRQKVLEMVPDYNPFHQAMTALPILEQHRSRTRGGGTFHFGPHTDATLGGDAEFAAGVEIRLTQPVDVGWEGMFETYATADALGQADNWMSGGARLQSGHAVRAGVSLTMGDLRLSYDQTLNGGVGEAMEGPSRQAARLAYAIRF